MMISTLGLALILAHGTIAQSVQTEEIVTNIWSSKDKCSSQNARKVSINKISKAFKVYSGQCVKISGIISSGSIMQSQKSGYSIGIYAREGDLNQPKPLSYRGTIVGIISTCELEKAPNRLILGFCEKNDGVIIKASELDSK